MMRRRVVKALAFLSVGLLVVLLLVLISERLAPVHQGMRQRRALLREQADEITVLSLGNSHASGIDFGTLGVRGFHFWRTAGDLHEARFLAQELVPELPRLRCIFVSLSPYGVHGDNGAPTRQDYARRRRELYAGTASRHYIAGDLRSFVQGKLSPVVRGDNWRGVLLAVAGRAAVPHITSDGAPARRATYAMSDDSLRLHGVRTAARHERWIREVLSVRPEAAFSGARALRQLVADAAARGQRVVIYTPPSHEAYRRAIPPERLAEARRTGRSIVAAQPVAVYLDYSELPLERATPRPFRDSGHLNEAGARAFSRQLGNDLRTAAPECLLPGSRGGSQTHGR